MARIAVALTCVALLATLAIAGEYAPQPAPQQPAGTSHTGNAFRFNKVADGVYHAIGTGALDVVGNSAVIVNDDGVIVVDDHVSPAAAWVLVDEIKTLTNKPIRTVINTHFHFDHAHGNQIFPNTVDIIGHEFTREMLTGRQALEMPLYAGYVAGLPNTIARL
jgi:cyclase